MCVCHLTKINFFFGSKIFQSFYDRIKIKFLFSSETPIEWWGKKQNYHWNHTIKIISWSSNNFSSIIHICPINEWPFLFVWRYFLFIEMRWIVKGRIPTMMTKLSWWKKKLFRIICIWSSIIIIICWICSMRMDECFFIMMMDNKHNQKIIKTSPSPCPWSSPTTSSSWFDVLISFNF